MSRRTPHASTRVRRGVAAAAWTGAVAAALFTATILVPWSPPPLYRLSMAVSQYDLFVALLAVAVLVLGLAAARMGARTTARAVVPVAAVATAASLLPAVSAWQAAGERGAELSAAEYFAPGLAAPEPDEPDAVYATADGRRLRMDVYRPDNGPGADPTVVRVHGGAWTTGRRGESPHWNAWLTARGYTVVDIDYRLAPPERWRQAPGDVACAVGRLRAEAGRYGVDPDRMMLFGQSAGGHLALLAAYGGPEVRPSCDTGDTSVDAVAAMYPVTDLGAWWRSDTVGMGTGGAARTALRAFTGGSPEERPGVYAAASPSHHVRKGAPPTLLLHGDRDHTVRPELSARFAQRLDAAGVPHTRVVVPYGDHAYDASAGSWGAQLSRDAMADFLTRRFPA